MTKPITTPKGKAIFPHLTEADYKFKSEGEYHVKLECLKSESENIIQTVGSLIAAKVKEQHDQDPNKAITKAPLPYVIEDDKVIFNFKMKASGINSITKQPFTQSPRIVDDQLNEFPKDKNIFGGSIVKINYEPVGYNVAGTGIGCTLRLKAVQVFKLVENTSVTQGFTKVEPELNQGNY